MKKLSMLPASLLLVLSLVGCANNNNTDNTNGNEANDRNNTSENTGAGESANGKNETNNDKNETNVEVADDIAKRISDMNEVENAYVLVTEDNAFVGVILKEDVTENDKLKSEIADEVSKDNSNLNNVYVSFNPDVAARLTEYADQIRAGEPIEGFIEEFTTGINRMFPESKYSPGTIQGLGKG
jgi:YhcN/YlaJ family sporulation lipoprotein